MKKVDKVTKVQLKQDDKVFWVDLNKLLDK